MFMFGMRMVSIDTQTHTDTHGCIHVEMIERERIDKCEYVQMFKNHFCNIYMSLIYSNHATNPISGNLNVLVLDLVDHDARIGGVRLGRREGRRSNDSGSRVSRRAGDGRSRRSRRRSGCAGGGHNDSRRSGGCSRRSGRTRAGGSRRAGGNSRAGSSRRAGGRAQGRGAVDLGDDPRRGVVGVQLKVVQVVGNGVSAGADWVAGCAVGTEDGRVTVETGEVIGLAAVGLLAGAVEHVVGLVGSVHDITPEESGTN
jgi:hypothetical protein